jgi:hypothetical protein
MLLGEFVVPGFKRMQEWGILVRFIRVKLRKPRGLAIPTRSLGCAPDRTSKRCSVILGRASFASLGGERSAWRAGRSTSAGTTAGCVGYAICPTRDFLADNPIYAEILPQ